MLALPSPANKHFSAGASRAEPSQEARPVELPPLHDPIGAVCYAGHEDVLCQIHTDRRSIDFDLPPRCKE